MRRTLPSQVRRFIASIPVIVLLAANSPARAQQRPALLSPNSQAQLEARVKDLENRLTAAEQKAASAVMEKEYILRTQNHYETYYKEVFSTQTHILWTIGVTVTLLGITLSVVFFVAGRFGFNIFDRRIEMNLKEASAQLRAEFTERLAKETNALREANAAQLKELEAALTKRITEQEEDLTTRSDYQFQFAQGLSFAANEFWDQAIKHFRHALAIYKSGKLRQLLKKDDGVSVARNIFVSLKRQGNPEENIKKQLSHELYDGLEGELALAAVDLKWLGPFLKERTQVPSPPVVAEQKTGESEPATPSPVPTPKAGK